MVLISGSNIARNSSFLTGQLVNASTNQGLNPGPLAPAVLNQPLLTSQLVNNPALLSLIQTSVNQKNEQLNLQKSFSFLSHPGLPPANTVPAPVTVGSTPNLIFSKLPGQLITQFGGQLCLRQLPPGLKSAVTGPLPPKSGLLPAKSDHITSEISSVQAVPVADDVTKPDSVAITQAVVTETVRKPVLERSSRPGTELAQVRQEELNITDMRQNLKPDVRLNRKPDVELGRNQDTGPDRELGQNQDIAHGRKPDIEPDSEDVSGQRPRITVDDEMPNITPGKLKIFKIFFVGRGDRLVFL